MDCGELLQQMVALLEEIKVELKKLNTSISGGGA